MQSTVVYDLLQYSPETSTLSQGVGLAFAFFVTQLLFSFLFVTMKMFNLRSGIRLKGACSLFVYKKIIALRGEIVSLGEVGIVHYITTKLFTRSTKHLYLMLISQNNILISNLFMDHFFPPVFQMINVITADSVVLPELYTAISIFCATPIIILIATIYSCCLLGATALIGQLVFLLLIGFQVSVLTFATFGSLYIACLCLRFSLR